MTTSIERPAEQTAPDWRARLRASRFGTVIVLALTTALVLVGAWLIHRPGEASTTEAEATGVSTVQLSAQSSGPAPEIGAPAPAFTARTTDGRPVSLASLKGRPVWLTFGASWCAACRSELPDIEATVAGSAARSTAVVAVFINEDASAVKEFGSRLGLTFPQVADPETTLASAYRVGGIPAHFFIDERGIVRATKVGALTPEAIQAALTSIAR